jgi:predicted transposase YdaD
MTEEERHRILLDANERQTRLYEERLKEAERKGLEEGERRGLVDGERRGLEEGERRGLLAAARAVLSVRRSASEVDSAISALEQCTGNDEIKVALTSLLR